MGIGKRAWAAVTGWYHRFDSPPDALGFWYPGSVRTARRSTRINRSVSDYSPRFLTDDMRQWARPREDPLAVWHLLVEPTRNDPEPMHAACGLSLGNDPERVFDESVIGNRCAVCQGIALRSG